MNEIFGDRNTDYYDAVKDLGYYYERFKLLYDKYEGCLINSLMRNLYVSNVEQFNRISKGEVELTPYSFTFKYREEQININVIPNSLPPSNIHILIGRNGTIYRIGDKINVVVKSASKGNRTIDFSIPKQKKLIR